MKKVNAVINALYRLLMFLVYFLIMSFVVAPVVEPMLTPLIQEHLVPLWDKLTIGIVANPNFGVITDLWAKLGDLEYGTHFQWGLVLTVVVEAIGFFLGTRKVPTLRLFSLGGKSKTVTSSVGKMSKTGANTKLSNDKISKELPSNKATTEVCHIAKTDVASRT